MPTRGSFYAQTVLIALGRASTLGAYLMGTQMTTVGSSISNQFASVLVSSQKPDGGFGSVLPLRRRVGIMGLGAVLLQPPDGIAGPAQGRRPDLPASPRRRARRSRCLTSKLSFRARSNWMLLSVAAVLPILWAFTLSLHFARPYVVRYLQTLTLRFGGDVWWLSYILIRDGLLVGHLRAERHLPLPECLHERRPRSPDHCAAGCAGALLGHARQAHRRRRRRTRGHSASSRSCSWWLRALHIPQVYGVEAGDQVDAWNSISSSLGGIPAALVSGSNPSLSYPILTSAWQASQPPARSSSYGFIRKTKFEPADIA